MKRDLDLCRQLLADLEGHGPDGAVTTLRPGVAGEADERVRYHVRLLIDAGLAKEVDRTAGGVPCVRLTDAGHELLELSQSEARWREAKWVVGERTGGQSLAVIKTVLQRWAQDAALYGEAWRPRRGYAPYAVAPYAAATPLRYYPNAYYRPYLHRVEPRYRYERDADPVEPRVASTRPAYGAYLERFDWRSPLDWRDAAERDTYYRDDYYREGYYRDLDTYEANGVSLPTHVV